MRLLSRLLLICALLCSVIGSACAQMGSFFPGPGTSNAGVVPTLTNFDSKLNGSCGFVQNCQVSTSLTIASGFNVFAAIMDNASGGTITITGLSLSGGCSGTLTLKGSTTSASGTGTAVALFYGTVTGGTCTVTVTSSVAGSTSKAGVAVGLLSNLSSTTPGTGCTGADQPDGDNNYPCSSGITVPAAGYGIAAVGYNNATTMTSSNLTFGSGAQANASGMSIALGYSTAPSVTPTFAGACCVYGGIVAAPWR